MTRGIVAFALLLVAWLAVYATGVYPWLGYASLVRRSTSAGFLTIAGEERMGTEFGPDEFWFFRGQEIVIDYDAEIRAGSLVFHVFRPFDGKLGDGVQHFVERSGKGRWTMPVKETGWYHVSIDPSVVRGAGKGWDLSYTVQWGASPGPSR